MLTEIVGIFASIVIIVSFLFTEELKMRATNLLGGVIFLVYAVLIRSFSNVFLQTVMIAVHIYKIYKIRSGGKKKNE